MRLIKGNNKIFFGVCDGLANYLNIDVVIVRFGFVIWGLSAGSGILSYIILAILMSDV